jgi:hypothetical protein
VRLPNQWRAGLGYCVLGLLAWGGVLAATGGVEFAAGPILFRSHDFKRPLLLAILCAVLLVSTANAEERTRVLRNALVFARRSARWAPLFVAVLSASVLVTGLCLGVRAAGASDVYGYVSQAELWEKGNLHVAFPEVLSVVPWPHAKESLSPLGYWPGVGGHDLVPIYPPGLPLLMALFRRIFGGEGQYLVGPCAGALAVWLTFWLGRRLTGRASVGAASAVLLAGSPAFLSSLVWPMSDLPVTVAWGVAMCLSLGGSWRVGVASGAVAALALVIRPNLVPLAVVFAAGWLVRATVERGLRASALGPPSAFALAILPGVIGIALLNNDLYGSPFRSGYASLSGFYALRNIVPNLRLYVGWILESRSWYVLPGMAAVFLPWVGVLNRDRVGRLPRILLAGFVLVVWACYLPYAQFDNWTYLRFLLPLWPLAVVLATALLAAAFERMRAPLAGLLLLLVAIGLAADGITWARRNHLFELRGAEQRYVEAAAAVKAVTSPRAVVFALRHSGSLRYYAGRTTFQYLSVDPEWLDRGIEALARHGYEPYVVIDEWELEHFRGRFGRRSSVGRLDWPPLIEQSRVLVYRIPAPSTAGAR